MVKSAALSSGFGDEDQEGRGGGARSSFGLNYDGKVIRLASGWMT